MKFSVLMAVYIKDNPDFFDLALESILINQTKVPDELVLVKDGPLTRELEEVVSKYYADYKKVMKIISLKENKGLGNALKIGLENATYEIIARMDSDDINLPDRFSKQINYLNENPKISIVGGNIAEFFDTIEKTESTRKTPELHQDICKMLKRRNPMNHVTVMFRKLDVIKAGGYLDLPYLEDYYLWVRVINAGYILANINETLVYVRTGEAMFARRSNKQYINSWKRLQSYMKGFKLINSIEYYINMINIYVFINIPSKLKKYIYKIFLRSK